VRASLAAHRARWPDRRWQVPALRRQPPVQHRVLWRRIRPGCDQAPHPPTPGASAAAGRVNAPLPRLRCIHPEISVRSLHRASPHATQRTKQRRSRRQRLDLATNAAGGAWTGWLPLCGVRRHRRQVRGRPHCAARGRRFERARQPANAVHPVPTPSCWPTIVSGLARAGRSQLRALVAECRRRGGCAVTTAKATRVAVMSCFLALGLTTACSESRTPSPVVPPSPSSTAQVTDVSPTHAPQKTAPPAAVQEAARITVSPASGPVGTLVTVIVEGLLPTNDLAPFVNVSFRDSAGGLGEDVHTTKYNVDTRTLPDRNRLSLQYQIPSKVLVRASAGDQNPTSLVATSPGPGVIVFSDPRGSTNASFTVTP